MQEYKSEFVNIIKERGFLHQCSDLKALDKCLAHSPQKAYAGYDATAPSLHIGNLVSLMMLRWFQECGHKPYILIGQGTTKIGDPSGKDESRQMLESSIINTNIKGIEKTALHFMKDGTGVLNNNAWLSNLNYLDFLQQYGKHFTINRMLTFDSVKTRLERKQALTFLEFNYMIMQAYDFLFLARNYGITIQMGGSDQWGNIINGIELARRSHGLDLLALTCPLLTTSSGTKMGKSAEGALWLNADILHPYDYYQFWRTAHDADIGRFLRIFTMLPINEIKRLESLPVTMINEPKKILAYEATRLCHGLTGDPDHIAQDAARVYNEIKKINNIPHKTKASRETSMAIINNLKCLWLDNALK